MKKMTKKEMFNQILTHLTDAAEIEFVMHEIELLEKKAGAKSGKPTANQVANEAVKAEIVEFLGGVESATIADITAGVAGLEGASNQKVSALMKQLVDAGEVVKVYEKRKAFFSKA